MGLAERADLIVELTGVPVGNHVLRNIGPHEPFGGGELPWRLRQREIRTRPGR